jgi:hypothetical protein
MKIAEPDSKPPYGQGHRFSKPVRQAVQQAGNDLVLFFLFLMP